MSNGTAALPASAITPSGGEGYGTELVLRRAQDAIAFERERAGSAEEELARLRERIADAREVAVNFLAHYGASDILMFRVAQDLASSFVKRLDGVGLVPEEPSPASLRARAADQPGRQGARSA